MLYLVYPKMTSTSIRQIRYHVRDVEGVVTICWNVSQRK
jgi:hypothetical protein